MPILTKPIEIAPNFGGDWWLGMPVPQGAPLVSLHGEKHRCASPFQELAGFDQAIGETQQERRSRFDVCSSSTGVILYCCKI